MDINQLMGYLNQLQAGVQGANAQARRAVDAFNRAQSDVEALKQVNAQQAQQLQHLMGLVQGLRIGKGASGFGETGKSPVQVGRPDMLTIEEIPGRRVPYDLTIQIGIPDGQVSPLQGSHILSTDGPFVAVARAATFISSYTFQITIDGSTQRYTGRTWGRQRPISSVLDLMDANAGWYDDPIITDGDCDGDTGPAPAVISRPTARAPNRSMVFDGYIELSSAVYPRQNQQVPSSLWAPGFNQMVQLPVLDYWEKGETVEVTVEPLHVNNPAAGNIQALLGSMPYLAGQFDGHEGIMYDAWQCTEGVPDIIARRPAGVLVIELFGYKILQPPGVRMR